MMSEPGMTRDQPSLWGFTLPTWRGDTQYIGSWVARHGTSVFDTIAGLADPEEKSSAAIQQGALNILSAGASDGLGAIGDAATSVAARIGRTVAPIFKPFADGLKLATTILLIGVAVYALLLAAPFIPRPVRS